MCHSLASKTCNAWNRAYPISDACHLVLTYQSKSRGELLRQKLETSKMADLNKHDIVKLIQLQTVLLLWAFSQLSNIATSTPAAKQQQIIVVVETLAGWSHFDDIYSPLKTLPYMEQRTLNCCVCVASVWVQTLVVCICHSACTVAWLRRLSLPVCDRP